MRLRCLRSEESQIIATLHQINEENVPAVGTIPIERMQHFARIAARFTVAESGGEPVAMLIAIAPDGDYDSPNFLWFRERRESFLYVDRIAVGEHHRRRGIGGLLYEDLFAVAKERGFPAVTCEVNLEPRNDRSLDFHASLGFVEVGRARAKGHLVAYLEREIDLTECAKAT